VIGRIPLVNDPIIVNDKEGLRVARREIVFEGFQAAGRYALALRRDDLPFEGLPISWRPLCLETDDIARGD
jgi:hypothetical protein